jgi:hypothetical protein
MPLTHRLERSHLTSKFGVERSYAERSVYVPVPGAECGIESFSPTAFASHAIGSESLNLSDELRDTLSRLLPSGYKIMYFFCSVTERLRASKAVNRNTNFSGWKRVTGQCFYLKSSFNSKEITRSGPRRPPTFITCNSPVS